MDAAQRAGGRRDLEADAAVLATESGRRDQFAEIEAHGLMSGQGKWLAPALACGVGEPQGSGESFLRAVAEDQHVAAGNARLPPDTFAAAREGGAGERLGVNGGIGGDMESDRTPVQ